MVLSIAQKVQAGATERSWPEGVAACATLFIEIAHRVVGDRVPIVGTVDGKAVMAAFLVHGRDHEGGDAPLQGRPCADHVVLHGDRLAFGVEPDLDLLVSQGPGEIHLHVVFAGIDQLHRLADRLGRGDRRNHHVRLQPATEAAAEVMLMDDDILGIGTGHRSGDRRRAGVELVAGIDMPNAVLLEGQRVHRLHRRMDIDARQIFGLDHLGRLFHGRGGVAILDEEDAFRPLFLQAAQLVDDRLVGHVGVWPLSQSIFSAAAAFLAPS